MQFTKLRLSGFKSFVEPTELLIEPGLTGVVGPNGCGKSNVVDALRWVMGESSAKGLRGGEMDDVIFAGTAGRPAFDRAEVSLQLRGNPGAGCAGPPGVVSLADGAPQDLEVGRRIARGEGSVYRVNGREVRARDVQLLFADASSGARSAAIIGQGRIGDLVQAKPTGRRQLLEEAAGIGGLHARRQEAESKLAATAANLERLGDLLGTLQEQLRGLRRQSRQAARYRELSAALREAEVLLLLGHWRDAAAEEQRAAAALADGRAAVAAANRHAEERRRRRDDAARGLPDLRHEEAELTVELARLGERARSLTAEAERLELTRRDLIAREHEIGADIERDGASAVEADAALARLEAERAGLERDEQDRAAGLAAAAAAEAEAAAATEAAEAELRRAVATAAAIEAEARTRAERRARLVAALAAAEAELRRLAGADPAAAEAAARMAAEAAERAAAEAEAAERERTAAAARVEAARAARAAAEAELVARRGELRSGAELAHHREERRRALAERAADLDGRRTRLEGRWQEIAARRGDREAARAAVDIAGKADAAAAARARLAETETALERAREADAQATAALTAAREEIRDREGTKQRLDSEAAALAELAGPAANGRRLFDAIEVEPGYETALAAALGDDLLAGVGLEAPSHWRDLGSEPPADGPALPDGAAPLAGFVKAPRALRRRLMQVGVVHAADAPARQRWLAQGQRLVSREGGLWRWDGFVRAAGGLDSATTRLRQHARRRRLAAELAEATAGLEAATARRTEAEVAQAGAATRLSAAEVAGAESGRVAEDAARTLAQAEAQDAALASELQALADEVRRLEHDRAEVQSEAEALAAKLREFDGPERSESELATLRHALETTRAEHEARSAELAAAEAEHERRVRAESECRRRAEAARLDAERRRSAAEAGRREWELRRESAAGEAERLQEELATLDAAIATPPDAARQALAVAEATAVARREELRERSQHHARLRDRQAAATARRAERAREHQAWTERAATGRARLAELGRRGDALRRELAALGEAEERLEAQRVRLRATAETAAPRRAALAARREAAEAALAADEAALSEAEATRAAAREEQIRLEAALEAAQGRREEAEAAGRARLGRDPAGLLAELRAAAERGDELPLALPTGEALRALERRRQELVTARERLGPVNLRAEAEAGELAARVEKLTAEQGELTAAVERLRRAIAALNREGRERLLAAFREIEGHIGALFARLFGGGRAALRLTDLEDPLNAGLELDASPPGKRLQSLTLLSGGEQALTALVLVFAVFLTRPSPVCVLDEVDAPLDDPNVGRLCDLMEDIARQTGTRFLTVTHHPLTMARMDRLYGVTMIEPGVSRLVSVDLGVALELRATA